MNMKYKNGEKTHDGDHVVQILDAVREAHPTRSR